MALEDTIKRLQAQQGASKEAEDEVASAVSQVKNTSLNLQQAMSKPQATEDQGGFGAAVRYGFAKEQGMLQDLSDYAISEYPQISDEGIKGALGIGPGVDPEWLKLSPQERRESLISHRMAKAKEIADYYNYAPGTSSGEYVGGFGAEVADPSSLFPIAKGVKAATVMGGALGYAGTAAEGLAEEGTIADLDPTDVVINTLLGAVTSGAFEAGAVDPVKNYVQRKQDQGIEVKPDELRTELDQQGFDTSKINFNELSKELNATFGTGEVSPSLNATIKQTKENLGITYEGLDIVDMEARMGMADQQSTEFKLPDFQDYTVLANKSIKPNPKFNKMEKELNANSLYTWKRKDGPKITKEPMLKTPGSFTRKKGIKEDPSLVYDMFEKQFAEKQEVFQILKNAVPVDSPLFKDVVNTMLKAPDKNKKFKGEFDLVPPGSRAYNINGISGEDVYGAIASQDIPWTSNLAQKMSPSIGTMASTQSPQGMYTKITEGATNWVSDILSPGDRISHTRTPAGKVASKLLTTSFNNTQRRIGETLTNYKMIRKNLGISQSSPEELLAIQSLRNTVDSASVTSKVKQLAAEVFKTQRAALRESMELGIITPEEFVEYTNTANFKGHLSRVYDHDKLNTAAGKQEFIERISTMALKGDDAVKKAEAILKAVLPKEEAMSLVKHLKATSDNGVKAVFIPPNIAESLWKNYGINGTTNYRSKHLDAPRVLPEEWEKAMEPFLVNDMEAILASWSQDVFTRIEYARQFGAKDELATEIYDEISKESSHLANDFFRTYFTALGDLKSKTVKSFVDRPEMAKKIIPRLKAFQTFKLGLAQIANLGQAPVNGLYYITAQDGVPFTSIAKVWLKGIGKGLKAQFGDSELAYSADKFGATTQTMLLDSMGGINESMHTIFGRKLPGPLEFFNNPSTMLRAVGYFDVEKMQRRMAYFMGQGMVEDALERKARYLALGNRANPKDLMKVNKLLEELGIDTTIDPSQASLHDKGMAGQTAANIINFTNDPSTYPHAMQTFEGKFFFQFKSYIVKQTNFINKNIIKPALRGNLKPLAAAMTVGTGVGIGVDEFRRWVLGDDKEYTMTEKVLRAHLMIGTFSMLGDLMTRGYNSAEGLASWLAGPTLSDAGRALYRGSHMAAEAIDEDKEVNYKGLAKDVTKTFVFPGRSKVLEALAEEKKSYDF